MNAGCRCACRQLFNVIQQSGSDRSFVVKAQFLEIYNEEVRDLLAPPGSQAVSTGGGAVPFSIGNSVFSSKLDSSSLAGVGPLGGQRSSVAIRECPDGQIIVTGTLIVTRQWPYKGRYKETCCGTNNNMQAAQLFSAN